MLASTVGWSVSRSIQSAVTSVKGKRKDDPCREKLGNDSRRATQTFKRQCAPISSFAHIDTGFIPRTWLFRVSSDVKRIKNKSIGGYRATRYVACCRRRVGGECNYRNADVPRVRHRRFWLVVSRIIPITCSAATAWLQSDSFDQSAWLSNPFLWFPGLARHHRNALSKAESYPLPRINSISLASCRSSRRIESRRICGCRVSGWSQSSDGSTTIASLVSVKWLLLRGSNQLQPAMFTLNA